MHRIIAAVVLTMFSLTCQAAILGPVAGAESEQVFSLASLMARNEPIALRHSSDRYDLAFPLAARLVPLKARLHLEFSNSNALLAHRSQLRVLLNGWQVAQIRLDPDNPNAKADMQLPVDRIKPGYNVLRFLVAQHYTDQHCEYPEAPELWTDLDTVKSNLVLSTAPAELKPTLGDLDRLLVETLRDYQLGIVQAGEIKTDEQLSWGGLIAQGVALRLKYAPFRVGLQRPEQGSGGLPDKADVVLIGKRDALQSQLGPEALARISGPYLGIAQRPNFPGAFQLVVSGTTDSEVGQAALAFTRLNFPFPDNTDTVISTQQEAPQNLAEAPGRLQEGRAYSFAQLGFKTLTFEEKTENSPELKLIMPADLYAPEDAQVDLWLHVAYRAALRRDSVINIKLNGHFERAVYLKDEGGNEYRAYRLSIPLRSFQAGVNILTFEPNPMPLVTGECQYIQNRLYVTLYEDSVVRLPEAAHYAKLPDLALFGRTGFPFTSPPDGSQTAIQLLDDAPQSIAAAWQVLANLAQINGSALVRAKLSLAAVNDDRHLLLIGGEQGLKSVDVGHSPLKLNRPNQLKYGQGQVFGQPEEAWLKRLDRWLSGEQAPETQSVMPQSLPMDVSGGLGDYRLVMAYPSSSHAGKLVMALVADTPQGLLRGVQLLTTPEFRYALKGDMAVWKDLADSVVSQDTGAAFFTGKAAPQLRLAAYFSRYPLYWVGAIVILLLVFAWISHRLLNFFKQRKHGDVKEFEG